MAIQDYYETLSMIDKKTVSDGMGGFVEDYVKGASFKGAITTDSSTEAKIAEQSGFTSLYTVTVPLHVPIKYYDILERERDGKRFRISSNPNDMETPLKSSLNFKQASAEIWHL